MKILHVITSLEIGGAQRLLSDILPLQKQGEEVSLLVYEHVDNYLERSIVSSGVKIICMNQSDFHNVSVIFKMRKIFKSFDIVHVHLFPSLYWAAIASIGLDVKLVYTEHNTSNKRRAKVFLRPIERMVYGRYDKIIAISRQTRETLLEWQQQMDERIVVINNGIDVNHFAGVKRPVIPKSLIMVSRFAPAKDQETVIRAMRYIDSGAILRFVGDGETLSRCKQLAIDSGVDDRVCFLGSREDVPELISESAVGIQSSHWEGFGLTAVEMMACGKPVLASDVEGLKQIVEGAGIIFKEGDERELAAKINSLLGDEELYRLYSEKCSRRALEYDIRKMSEKYMDIYRTLCPEK